MFYQTKRLPGRHYIEFAGVCVLLKCQFHIGSRLNDYRACMRERSDGNFAKIHD